MSHSKNINSIKELNHTNYMDKLNLEDWQILLETDEEFYRKGNFERVFPNRAKGDYYLNLMEFPRYNNILVQRWLQSPVNFLEKVFKKNEPKQ